MAGSVVGLDDGSWAATSCDRGLVHVDDDEDVATAALCRTDPVEVPVAIDVGHHDVAGALPPELERFVQRGDDDRRHEEDRRQQDEKNPLAVALLGRDRHVGARVAARSERRRPARCG